MQYDLPADAPKTTGEAFAYVGRLVNGATIDDLKILALVEAIGLKLYEEIAERAAHPEVKKLLLANGREELAHAHRVGKAIEILTGKAFPIPAIDQNPLYTGIAPMPVTKAAFAGLVTAEFSGNALYDGVASRFDNPEVIALFKQNGEEETGHGQRLQKAIEFLTE